MLLLDKSLSVHTWIIISPFLQNTDFSVFKWWASHSRSDRMPPLVLMWQNCVLQLLPLGCIYHNLTDISWNCLTHHSDQHFIFCYFPWTARPKFQVTTPWDGGFFRRQFFGLQTDLTWNSADNVHTIFWIAFLHLVLSGLFCHQNYQVTTFCLLLYMFHFS